MHENRRNIGVHFVALAAGEPQRARGMTVVVKDYWKTSVPRCLKKHIKTVHENRRNIGAYFVALAAGDSKERVKNKDYWKTSVPRCLKKHIKTVHENRRNIRVHFVALAAGEQSARNDAERLSRCQRLLTFERCPSTFRRVGSGVTQRLAKTRWRFMRRRYCQRNVAECPWENQRLFKAPWNITSKLFMRIALVVVVKHQDYRRIV